MDRLLHDLPLNQRAKPDSMTIGKSIRIYLSEGTVTGIRYVELVNWTGQAVACPRNRLSELAEWPEANNPGVYFLFEGQAADSKPLAYIGESENVAKRLASHDRQKEFWNEVVIFTSKDENLTKAHVKYLESSLATLTTLANRYELENGNTPPEASLPRADRDAMEEFIVNVRMILPVLGHPILEPLLREPSVVDPTTTLSISQEDEVDILQNLTFGVNNLEARGAVTDEGFVLKTGSQVSLASSESMPGKLHRIKQGYIDDGTLTPYPDCYVASRDILFGSSSYAAAIVAGTSRSGPQGWKADDGRTIKQIEDERLGDT